MNNKKLIKKVKELAFQTLKTKEQSLRVMIQISIIRKAYGIKEYEYELGAPVKDYERDIVLSDDEIKKEVAKYAEWINIDKKRNDYDHIREIQNTIHYFIDGVSFFNKKLANMLKEELKEELKETL